MIADLPFMGCGFYAVVAEGCAAPLDAGSPSAAVMFAGHPPPRPAGGGYLLGVEASMAEALARWFLWVGVCAT